MAGIGNKLAASSLMEVVVAMVLISIVATVSLLIYLNVMRSMSVGYRYQMESAAIYYLDQYDQLPEDQRESFTDDNGFFVVFEEKETAYDDLRQLELTLSDSLETHQVTHRKLIYRKE